MQSHGYLQHWHIDFQYERLKNLKRSFSIHNISSKYMEFSWKTLEEKVVEQRKTCKESHCGARTDMTSALNTHWRFCGPSKKKKKCSKFGELPVYHLSTRWRQLFLPFLSSLNGSDAVRTNPKSNKLDVGTNWWF